MLRMILKQGISMAFMLGAMVTGAYVTRTTPTPTPVAPAPMIVQQTAAPMETIPPNTPLPSLTPSKTLRPPPTFEPASPTPAPSDTPTLTLTPTLFVDASISGFHGAATPTPSTTPGCTPRADWALTYTVQRDDALESIARRFNTTTSALTAGNCIQDPNRIYLDQVLRVPGDAPPTDAIACKPFELLTPINGAVTVPAEGRITFNWRGPDAPLNLMRIHRPDGSFYERLVELRQNENIDLSAHLRQGGIYTWYVYPLDRHFQQIACPEGGPWTFSKGAAATYTPTVDTGNSNPSTNTPTFSPSSTPTQAPTNTPSATPPPTNTPVAPPNVQFDVEISSLAVRFHNRSTGLVDRYEWDFGDGTTSQEHSPQHVYQAAGTYPITLTAYGPGGTVQQTGAVTVQMRSIISTGTSE